MDNLTVAPKVKVKEDSLDLYLKDSAKSNAKNTIEGRTFSAQFMAAIISNANSRGILPNAEMMAKEAVKYAEALLLELSK